MNRSDRVLIAGLICGVAAALPTAPLTAKEARPPKLSSDVFDTFFDDAREKLEGPRPDYTKRAAPENSIPANSLQRAGNDEFAWSKRITAETLESEVKRLSKSLSSSVNFASAFKGGGYKDARRDFSELAVLFAVLAQYDGDARWKDAAPGLRELFTRAAANCKVGTDATFREASARKQDLADLIRGGRPQLPKAEASIADWSQVAAREPLMQRLNIAHQERLTKWLADPAILRHNQAEIQHEAQIVALLAEVIHCEAFEFWDDEIFVGYACDLQRAASDVAAAAAADNYDQARPAIGRATNACANCHEGYRG